MSTTALLFLVGVVLSEGLELTLDGDTKFIQGNFATCGVLRCTDSSDSSRPLSISKMSILSRSHAGTDQLHLVTNVSAEWPRVSRFYNGVKMDGTWSEREVGITLYLLRADLCTGTEFTCEVRAVDENGEELVSTSSVGRPAAAATGTGADGETSEGALPAACPGAGVGGQEVKEAVQHLQAWLENAVGKLENRLEDKLSTVKSRVDDKIATLQGRLEDKISTLQNRLDDKLSTLQAVFEDNSRQLENRLEDKLDAKLGMGQNRTSQNQEKDQPGTNVNDYLDQKLRSLEGKLNATVKQKLSELEQLFDSEKHELYANATEATAELRNNLLEVISEANRSVRSDILSNQGAKLESLPRSTCEQGSGGTAFHPVVARHHVITPSDDEAPYVCDPHTAGGGWIVIQRRSTGHVNFARDWAAYREGFGSLDGDFWLGNERIHTITSKGMYELRVDLNYEGESTFAHYDSFSVDNEANNFTVRLGTHSGTAGDAFQFRKVIPFSSSDRDNDGISSTNCAKKYTGAWWFWPANCINSFLNGQWVPESSRRPKWLEKSLGFSEMKIRPVKD